ncbi:M28 family peptidase [Rhizomonospora bruguierae]|uniref:M28 family peptidase n=1 Tax=Rhizomonospora bruguierae TaxID=1581705 RepID=UPI0020BEE67B|nr:M28 family peptidase [Micromonospora sp. NBRC 107566]
MDTPKIPARPRLAGAAALLALAALGALVLWTLLPPAARGTGTPAAEFSADRAYELVRALATAPHPAGSAGNDGTRARIESTLTGLGLRPEVQDTVAVEAGDLSGSRGASGMARVRNVVAVLPGTAPTGRVFLVAHYDSVQTGPGANDDSAGVSTLLEVARALSAGARPRNDVVFVFTDAEEACLCGAAAFATQHPLAKGPGVVLNLEARGSTGPVIMFETSRDNAALVGGYARGAPHPVGTSFAVEVYRLLPNDTDFTAFRAAGMPGLNSAYIDGSAVYHTPLDTPASMDRASLQQHGDNALGMAREFGGADLTRLRASGDATYFPVLGALARYPGWLTWPIAVLAALAVAALAYRRRGRRLAVAFGLGLIPLVLAPAAAQGFWAVLVAVRPGYRTLLDPYRPQWYRVAVLALAAAVLLAWYAALRRRVGADALATAALGWLAVLGVVLAVLVPGGSYLAALPALAGAAAALVNRAPTTLATLAGAVSVVVLLPAVVLLLPALTLAMAGAGAFFAVLLGFALLPVLERVQPARGRWRAAPAGLCLALTVGFAATGLAVDRFDAAHPVPTQLMYALDADTGQARWVSQEDRPQPWTAGYVDGSAVLGQEFPPLGNQPLRVGPAPAAPLPAPRAEVLADTRAGEVRTLRLRVAPQRAVRLVALAVDATTATVRRATVDGQPARVTGERDGRWGFRLVFHAPPPDGIEVTLELEQAPGTRLTFRVMDGSDGLDGLPGFRPRPPDVGVVGSHSSELVLVGRTYTF